MRDGIEILSGEVWPTYGGIVRSRGPKVEPFLLPAPTPESLERERQMMKDAILRFADWGIR